MKGALTQLLRKTTYEKIQELLSELTGKSEIHNEKEALFYIWSRARYNCGYKKNLPFKKVYAQYHWWKKKYLKTN